MTGFMENIMSQKVTDEIAELHLKIKRLGRAKERQVYYYGKQNRTDH